MSRLIRLISLASLFSCLVFVAGCERGPGSRGADEPAGVPVAHPKQAKVRDYVYYTGRTNAKDSVTIVPRVTGYLEKMPFKEGAEVFGPRVAYMPFLDTYLPVEVSRGTLLFEVDDRPYKAQLAAAKAAVKQNEESLRYAQLTNERYKEIEKKQTGAVSKQELDQYQAQEGIAEANLNLARANLISAELNLDWTAIRN